MSYNSAPEAYKWNNKKWNNSTINPSLLADVRVTDCKGDYIRTEVDSVAKIVFDITVTTVTSFEFKEKADGSCLLVFYNEITKGPGSDYLKTNPDYKADNFEKNKYYYALELQ